MGMNEPNFPWCKKPALSWSKEFSNFTTKELEMLCMRNSQRLQVLKDMTFSEENLCKNSNHFPTRIFASVESGNSLPTCNPVVCPFVLGRQRIVNQTTIDLR
jgi:hypothetical protein